MQTHPSLVSDDAGTARRGRSRAAKQLIAILFGIAVVATACSTDEPQLAPFDQVLVDVFGTTDTDRYRMAAERRAAQLVATCMQEAGFEYHVPAERTVLEEPDPTNLEQAQEQGFGIVAAFRHQVQSTDLNARLGRDLNQIYLSTLTPAEVNRFSIVLNGPPAEPGQRQNGGCNASASEIAFGDWDRFFTALPHYTVLGEERDTHPDWLATRATWRDCMAKRGFDYSEPGAIRADVILRMRDVVAQVYPGGQVPLVEVDGAFTVDPAVDELLAELVQFEQSAAVANVECAAPLAEQFAAVEFEVQQDFVDRNRATIDELLRSTSGPSDNN